jgi:hypothetical protein
MSRLEAEVHNLLPTLGDGHPLIADRLAVLDRLNAVVTGAEPDFLRSSSSDDHHVIVDLYLHVRIVDLDHQGSVRGLDAEDGGHEFRDLGQSRGLGDAQAGDGQQGQPRGQSQPTPGAGQGLGRTPIPTETGGRGSIEPQDPGRRQGGRLLEVGEPAFQQVGDLGGRLESVGRPLGQQPVDHSLEPVGHLRVELTDRPVPGLADVLEHGHRRVGAERRPARGHGVEHRPQGKQVGAGVDGLALGLLGGHVLRRARNDAAGGQAGVVDGPGQAEVGELDHFDTVLEQNVGRLDVAVHDSLGMRCRQRTCRLGADPQEIFHLQGPGGIEPLLKGTAGNVLHDQVREPETLIDGMNRHDMLVPDGGHGPGLAGKPAAGGGTMSQDGAEHLDRHGPIQRWVAGLEHKPHPTPAQDFEDLIGPEPANRLRVVGIGRVEESEPVVVPLVVLLPALTREDTLGNEAGGGRAARIGLTAEQARVSPEVAGGRHLLQLLAAGRA